jgi:hypothetical protein
MLNSFRYCREGGLESTITLVTGCNWAHPQIERYTEHTSAFVSEFGRKAVTTPKPPSQAIRRPAGT